ncbi:PAAR domain-containing protein [Aquimarina longa]|uniref:PAAR domain-containing protein n=1 Tax=Aquimarina longa TaxID=1080221 RepID=UPI0009EB03EC|nr:PAAR domain-containing protein [Aquimarina longa]
MTSKPIAVVGSMHSCPMYTGSTPHIGGAIITSAAPGVTINGQAIALQGDSCACVGATDMIVQGSSGVFINGIPIATVDCKTAHGGVITTGIPGVTLTTTSPETVLTLPEDQIPFPESTLMNRILGTTRIAQENQDLLRQPEEGTPRVVNPRWIKEERLIRQSKVIKRVTLQADTYTIPDGGIATIRVKKPIPDADGYHTIEELSGQVQDKKVTIVWETEEEPNTASLQ